MSAALQSIRLRDLPRRLPYREVQSLDVEDDGMAFFGGFPVLQLTSQVRPSRRISRVEFPEFPCQNLTHGSGVPHHNALA